MEQREAGQGAGGRGRGHSAFPGYPTRRDFACERSAGRGFAMVLPPLPPAPCPVFSALVPEAR